MDCDSWMECCRDGTSWNRCLVHQMGRISPARCVGDVLEDGRQPLADAQTLICNTPKSHTWRIVHLKEAWMMVAVKAGAYFTDSSPPPSAVTDP